MIVIDDEPAVRTLVRMLFDHAERFELVAEAGQLAPGVELVEEHRPDIVLLDLLMPDATVTDALQRLSTTCPDTMLLILSALSGLDEAADVFDAGAFAYLEKSLLGPPLVDELEDLHRLFRDHRGGIDVWARPDRPQRTRS